MDRGFRISYPHYESKVLFEIENTGIDAVEDIIFNFKFNNMAIPYEQDNPKWQAYSNIHGMGLWQEIRFTQTNEPLYKDLLIKITFNFYNAWVDESNANIEVTLSSKGCAPKKFTIPVKVNYSKV